MRMGPQEEEADKEPDPTDRSQMAVLGDDADDDDDDARQR